MQYPFSAIVGQEKAKKAFILNFINPAIGGVLLSGQKGTAKSTMVRAAAELVKDRKLVELPLHISEDRLLGGIDIGKALRRGEKRWEQGVLQAAEGQILYVDEINLLSQDVSTPVLEQSESFLLIGSMNPEEGGLGAQLLDRFGLYVLVEGEKEPRARTEIISRCLEYGDDPGKFRQQYEEENHKLAEKIRAAKARLPRVEVTPNAMGLAADMVRQAGCQGNRTEILLIQTAIAIAAWEKAKGITWEYLVESAQYVLPHRGAQALSPQVKNPGTNQEPRETPKKEEKHSEMNSKENPESVTADKPENSREYEEVMPAKTQAEDTDRPKEESRQPENGKQALPEEGFEVNTWLKDKQKAKHMARSGMRKRILETKKRGRYVRSCIGCPENSRDIAFDATMRAAALSRCFRDRKDKGLVIRPEDIRVKVREGYVANHILFVVDASASMGAYSRMEATKGAVLSLFQDAYQKRDKIGLIAFQETEARVLLEFTNSVELAGKRLADIPVGGRTPLAKGIRLAHEMMQGARAKDRNIYPVLVLITDGRATYGETKHPFEEAMDEARKLGEDSIRCVLVNTEQGYIKLGLAQNLASAMGIEAITVEDLKAEHVQTIVRHAIND